MTAGTPVVSAAPKSLHGTPLPYHTPSTQMWSFDVQHQLTRTAILDVGYYGSKGTHLLGMVDINEVPPGFGVATGVVSGQVTSATTPRLNAVRPFLGYNAINDIQTRFNSNYNSLQTSLEKRFSGDSMIGINYTWSRAMSDNQTDRSTAPQNTYDIRAEYGRMQLDRRHILTADFVYDLPWMRNQAGFAGHVIGGWEISGVITANSGAPLTVISGAGLDPAGLGILGPSAASPRPDMVADPNSNAPRTIAQWFNPAAFAEVPAGQIRPGNAGRGTVNGPGFWNVNLSVFKNIKIHEDVRLQVRGESFNLLNHMSPLNVGTTTNTPSFGQVTTTHDPRIIQLALKLYF